MSRYYRKNEFRHSRPNTKIGKHIVHVNGEYGNKYRVNVITHSKRFLRKPTYPLYDNPNKRNFQTDTRKSRISVPVIIKKKSVYNKKVNNSTNKWDMKRHFTQEET